LLEQRLKLAPQLYQSLKLMELPVVDLREKIEEEIERNPALEVIQEPATLSLDETAAESAQSEREDDDYMELSSDISYLGGSGRSGEDAAEEKRRFLEGAIARPETLQEHLMWQLALESADGDVRRIGELIIQNLDPDGFHKEPLDILLKGEEPGKIEEALALVQGLDPAGCGTSGYME